MSSEVMVSGSYSKSVNRVLFGILVLNIAVVLGKVMAGWMANSLGVLSDALHSSVDSLNNLVGIFVIRMASAPPDREHPYGHKKYESLAAFCISAFLFITCFQLLMSAFRRLTHSSPSDVEISALTFWVMVVTIAVNIFVVWYETRRGRELNSDFLIADALHTKSDIFVSLSVLAGIWATYIGLVWADAAVAIVVALFIAYSGFQIFRNTVPVLVDAAPVSPEMIEKIVNSTDGVHSCHDIRSRGQRGSMFIELHVVIETGDSTAAHEITERVEKKLSEEFGRCNVTIHVEPSINAN